jgi:hypothetical protein
MGEIDVNSSRAGHHDLLEDRRSVRLGIPLRSLRR